MDEEFESLVVTDPDIVDEGIDVSAFKTQTDVSPYLLGNIPDYAGIQYEAFNPKRLSELMRLYEFGAPMIDTPAAAAPPDTGGGGGEGDSGGGGATIPVTPIAPITPINPIPPAGGGADMGTVPVTQPDTGGITSDPIEMENIMDYENPYDVPMNVDDPGASIENILQPNIPGTIPGRPDIFDINQTGDPSQSMLDVPTTEILGTGVMPAFGDMPTDFTLGPAYTGEFDPDDEGTVFNTFEKPEQENTVKNIFGKIGQTVEGALTELGKIPGAVVDSFNKTVDVFGKKIDVGKTLAGIAFNTAVGGPATFAIQFASQFLPEQDPRVKKLNDFYSKGEGAKYVAPTFSDGTPNPNYIPGMEDYNTISGGFLNTITGGKYGTPTNYGLQGAYQKRIDRVEKTLADKYGMTASEIEDAKAGKYKGDVTSDLIKRIENLEDVKKEEADMLGITAAEEKRIKELEFKDFFAGNIDDEDTQAADAPTAPIGTFDADTFDDDDFDTTPPAPPTQTVPDFISGGGGRDRDDSPAPSAPVSTAGQAGPPSQRGGGADIPDRGRGQTPVSTRGQAGPPSQRGGGGRSAGGYGGGAERGSQKIVCSMMNESYGFGSFRNKIWLRHSKNLAPEYEKGYHKIFLPLVNYAKKDGVTNKIVKKTIEHLMVHRTIDIRQEARGKMHLLGRIYRKIFEPICYFVGKHG